MVSVISSGDSIRMVRVVPGGPSPKNSGLVVLTISPSSTLSRTTVSAEEVAISPSGTVNLDEGVLSSGSPILASGRPEAPLPVSCLKSWVCPRIMGGVALAAIG